MTAAMVQTADYQSILMSAPFEPSTGSSSDDSHVKEQDDAADGNTKTDHINNYHVERTHFQNFKSPQACLEANRCVSMCEAYGRVCPHSAQRAAEYARKHLRHLFHESDYFVAKQKDSNETNEFVDFEYRVDQDDLKIGDLLGTGGFCSVHACTIPSLTKPGEPDALYAVKTLRRQCMCNPDIFKHGAADLALEAHFLQALQHEHIIQIHAVPKGNIFDNIASAKPYGYFIVLDRLTDTLDKRIEQWHAEQEKHHGSILSRWSHDFREHKRLELVERLRVAYAIADALEYLHLRRVIFRDLKPDNIGFTPDGVVKLFDFGLAKELKADRANDDGMYVLSGNTGSRRYMASEVAKGLPYNFAVDVYSFGIMLWEMCSAEKPFLEYTCGKHMQNVVLGGERPSMDARHTSHWPMELQWLMTRCWAEDTTQRPSFTVIKETIRELLVERKPETSTQNSSLGERQRPGVAALVSPSNDHAHHGIGSFFHRKPHEDSSSPLPSSATLSPRPPGANPAVLPPTAAILSGIKPVANQRNARAKTWGFTLRKKST